MISPLGGRDRLRLSPPNWLWPEVTNVYAYAKLACRTLLSEEVKAGLAMVLRTSKGEMHRSLRCSPQGKTHATMDNKTTVFCRKPPQSQPQTSVFPPPPFSSSLFSSDRGLCENAVKSSSARGTGEKREVSQHEFARVSIGFVVSTFANKLVITLA